MSKELRADNQEISQTGIIARAAVKTLFALVTVGLVLITVIMNCIPFYSMRFFADFGMYGRALDYAATYVSLNDGEKEKETQSEKYLEALTNAIEYSEMLMIEDIDDNDPAKTDLKTVKKHAKRLTDYTATYAALTGIDAVNTSIDEFNLNNSSYLFHRLLYSYRDYIYRTDYRARLFLGEPDKLLFDGKVINALSAVATTEADGFTYSTANVTKYAVLLNQLYEYADYELYALGYYTLFSVEDTDLSALYTASGTDFFTLYYEDSSFTDFYGKAFGFYEKFASAAAALPDTTAPALLKKLFVLDSVQRCSVKMGTAVGILRAAGLTDSTNQDKWSLTVTVGEGEVSLKTYIDSLMTRYAAYYS